MSQALQFLILAMAGWLNRKQENAVEYLRLLVREYVEHYHRERNRQGLENRIIDPDFGSDGRGEVQCRQRLGGLLRYYYRDAA